MVNTNTLTSTASLSLLCFWKLSKHPNPSPLLLPTLPFSSISNNKANNLWHSKNISVCNVHLANRIQINEYVLGSDRSIEKPWSLQTEKCPGRENPATVRQILKSELTPQGHYTCICRRTVPQLFRGWKQIWNHCPCISENFPTHTIVIYIQLHQYIHNKASPECNNKYLWKIDILVCSLCKTSESCPFDINGVLKLRGQIFRRA